MVRGTGGSDDRRDRLRLVAHVASLVTVAICVALTVAAWRVAGDIVPVHWDWQLRPDRYGSRSEGLLLPLAALVFVIACFRFTTTHGKSSGAGESAAYVIWIASVALIGVLVATTTYNTAFGEDVGRSPMFLPALVAVIGVGTVSGIRGAVRDQPPAPADVGDPRAKYWFKAKRYGYGWSRPSRWQGWVITVAYIGAQIAAAAFGGAWRWLGLVGLVIGTPLLLWACARKGEPARWRWGGRD